MKTITSILLFLLTITVLANDSVKKINNPWLKTYNNYKNYSIVISNIVKIEEKLKNQKISVVEQEELNKKLSINKSKLSLYEKNNSLDSLLIKYKTTLPEITLSEFIFKNKLFELNKTIKKYEDEKTLFYFTLSTFENEYEKVKDDNLQIVKMKSIKSDIDFLENILKILKK